MSGKGKGGRGEKKSTTASAKAGKFQSNSNSSLSQRVSSLHSPLLFLKDFNSPLVVWEDTCVKANTPLVWELVPQFTSPPSSNT